MAMRIAVFGAGGKVGRAIVRAVVAHPDTVLAAAIERQDSPDLGQDAGQLAGLPANGIRLTSELPATGVADAWIDFTIPKATMAHVHAAVLAKASMVIGTTGLGEVDKAAIQEASRTIPIVFTPNFSVGVNVLLQLVADATRLLGQAYDIEIVETHHRAKRDAPSGTALRLAEAVAEASGRNLAQDARYQRHGDIGPRSSQEIGMQTLRGGDVAGDHTVHFLGQGDRIEITHRATSRDTFAHGSIRAALWLEQRPAGLYDMRNVLGLVQIED
jgi:4-hydroxy-tetrahydrodipicolinate reductase